jgi:hypothetical protein
MAGAGGLLRHSYHLTRAAALLRLRRRDRRARALPVLVYQMGNVGSRSVVRAVQSRWPGPVAHFHTLDTEELAASEKLFRRQFKEHREVPSHTLEGLHIARRLRREGTSGSWRVITMVRDPVARNLSAFFMSFRTRLAGTELLRRIRAGGDPTLVQDLIDRFVDTFNHRGPLAWFDRELRAATGVDVFASSFSPDRGAQVYEGPIGRILLLRLEDLNRVGREEICAFLDLPDLEISVGNQSTASLYGEVFAQIRDRLRMPAPVLDAIYESKLCRHFYTETEREAFRARWRS